VEYLHGRMKAEEKNDIMERFSSGKIQVLVSTTVVEVGVNVPNATVMMIENSERFGLAQLHQLRGRVGRGKDQSYCIFMYSAGGETIRKRLEILENSNDGFEIASKDLELRGPGELFGVRQSGEVAFNLADPFTDAALMQEASEAAAELLQRDPRLELPEHLGIRKQLEDLREKGMAHLSL
jgi:ATP-dependent DNA helicase RecG